MRDAFSQLGSLSLFLFQKQKQHFSYVNRTFSFIQLWLILLGIHPSGKVVYLLHLFGYLPTRDILQGKFEEEDMQCFVVGSLGDLKLDRWQFLEDSVDADSDNGLSTLDLTKHFMVKLYLLIERKRQFPIWVFLNKPILKFHNIQSHILKNMDSLDSCYFMKNYTWKILHILHFWEFLQIEAYNYV